MSKPKRVYILGDLHGSAKPVRRFYQDYVKMLDKTDNTLILLGDAGLNFFFNHRDEEFKKKLSKYPFTYFVIRGNHEQRPSICMEEHINDWTHEEFWDGRVMVEKEYPYIKYAEDSPSVYYIETEDQLYKTLTVPGAYSVDKYKRLQEGWSWFPAEQLTEEEMGWGREIVERDPAFDLVLSHTCPIMYEPTDLFLPVVNQATVDKTMERYLGELEFKLDYRAWCWAHYHQFRDYPRPDGRFRTMLFNDYALDLDEYMKGEINKL